MTRRNANATRSGGAIRGGDWGAGSDFGAHEGCHSRLRGRNLINGSVVHVGLSSMNASTHFDAAAYWRAGNCPWTFFAYPRAFTDAAGLPPDDDAKRLL